MEITLQDGMYSLKQIKVKYIGKDRADIRNGDIYDASEVRDDPRYYGIVDRSGEEYAYPKSFFGVVNTGEFVSNQYKT